MKNISAKVLLAWKLLYYMYGFVFIIAGVDKYFNYLVDWSIYVNEHLIALLSLTPQIFLYTFGAVEIFVGLLVFVKPRIGGYVVITLLFAICINLMSMGAHYHEQYTEVMLHYDVVLHDIALAIGAYVFVLLSEELGR